MDRKRFGAFMLQMGGLPKRERNGVIGEHMVDVEGLSGRRAETHCRRHLSQRDKPSSKFPYVP
jgi:hypothetical protein